MSLKKETVEIFTHFGLTEEEYKIYLVYLGQTQATTNEVAEILEKDLESIKKATQKLEEKKFLKKVPSTIEGLERFIPLEPYFSLFTKEQEVFRSQIGAIKDTVLGDQSKRFEKLEGIEKNAIKLIDTAVSTQVNEFFKTSDAHDVDKKGVIEKARDRFTQTSKAVEKNLQEILFKGRDRYEATSKALEADLHKHINDNNAKVKQFVDTRDLEANKVWDDHDAKFTADNNKLNSELDGITKTHVDQTKALELSLHKVLDDLNAQLKTIATEFKSNYNTGIVSQKDTLNKIVDGLLSDVAKRLANLEVELKKDLDAHVDNHKENAEKLKPSLQQILEKYMKNMKAVLEELKKTISKLLLTHSDHVNTTTTKLKNQLNQRVEDRQNKLINQVQTFESNTVILIDNLKDINDKLTELGKILSSRGSAWKALFLGRHKYWMEVYEEIKERVSKISGSMKDDFKATTANYITETGATKTDLQKEITDITAKENAGLKKETEALDKKQQEQINAELEGLAKDLAKETDATLQYNIKHCKDTTIKLKDSLEKTLHTHKQDYDLAVNQHRTTGLNHYDTSNNEVKTKVDGWFGTMDREHTNSKNNISTLTNQQIKDVNDHLVKSKDSNNNHSKEFDRDVKEIKTTQRRIFDDLEREVLDDFKLCKNNISEKINAEIGLIKDETKQMDDMQHQKLDEQITLFTDECKGMEDKLHAMLEEHKAKYQENATNVQQELTKTIRDNIQNVKDAIADFTLNFMNSIDEATEKAEITEGKLTEIFNASESFIEKKNTTTWHLQGIEALTASIVDSVWRVKSTIIIVTPVVVPKILEALSQAAYKKKAARFFYTCNFDLVTYGPIIEKMKQLGNIQFRNLKASGEFFAVSRDAEEVILGPNAKTDADLISIISIQEGYCQLYSSFIGPIFQANSRPI